MKIILLLISIGISVSVSATTDQDSLLQLYRSYLEQAEQFEDDLVKEREWAQRAADGFTYLQADSLLMEAELLLANVASFNKDSLAFEHSIAKVLRIAQSRRDTAALIRAYNQAGQFYFRMGNLVRGIATLKVPDERNYFVPEALEATLNNLGALIDVNIYVTRNIDSTYFYLHKLQRLAIQYDDPAVQVVTRFKLSQLLRRAADYEKAVNVLREAYPYLGQVKNKGFLHYYYRELVNNFILLEKPDSSYYYSSRLQAEANYQPGNPRYCQVAISQAHAMLLMGNRSSGLQKFEDCFSQLIDGQSNTTYTSRHALEALYVKCSFALEEKDWGVFDQFVPILINSAESADFSYYLHMAYDLKCQAMMERGSYAEALEAFQQFKSQKEKLNNYIFSQAQFLARNQMRLELAEEENRLLQAENSHQRLKIANDRIRKLALVLSVLLLVLFLVFLLYLNRQRLQQRKELEDLVHQRTQQLEVSNMQLSQSNDELSASNIELERFAYIASHDLKTPLHNMIKFTGLLQRELKAFDNDNVKDYLAFIVNGGKRMNMLIEDMLEYSRFSKVENVEYEGGVNLHDVVQDICTAISEYIEQRKATVEVLSPLATLKWSNARMFILLKNLIENGIKYNESVTPLIQIYAQRSELGYSLFVADNGIGIEAEFTSKVFQMFARLHTHGEYEGSGLGLATCKKIVGEFGGTITFESELGQGTTFKVLIPSELIIDDSTSPTPTTHSAKP